jgi:small subunit ribosomal protein S16
MVKIRLRRMGAPKKPSYRIVVADSKSPRNGAFLSIIGHYDPLTNPEKVDIDQDAALSWLQKGAQPTVTVARLLTKAGVMDKLKASKEAPKETK